MRPRCTVRDPRFRSIEDPFVSLQRGRARGCASVRSVSGFTQGETTHMLSVEKWLLEDFFLLGSGKFVDGAQIQGIVHAQNLRIEEE